jgi:hypothetical protein
MKEPIPGGTHSTEITSIAAISAELPEVELEVTTVVEDGVSSPLKTLKRMAITTTPKSRALMARAALTPAVA